VVVTGGHLPENTDLLVWTDGGGVVREELFEGERIDSNATHGTGCAFATAIACNLARGNSIPEAVRAAKVYVRKAIEVAPGLGKGKGPMGHLFRMKID
jgi:hydroxymethylpyrimidine/phosphomethylpyrimidine kinase